MGGFVFLEASTGICTYCPGNNQRPHLAAVEPGVCAQLRFLFPWVLGATGVSAARVR